MTGGVVAYGGNGNADAQTVVATQNALGVTITDVAPVNATLPCTAPTSTTAFCPNATSVTIDTGDAKDTVDASALTVPVTMTDDATTSGDPQTFTGGAAADTITSSAVCFCGGFDTLYGGEGNDTLVAAGAGNYALRGQGGNDILRPTTGAVGQATMSGGNGIDRADYTSATASVVIGYAAFGGVVGGVMYDSLNTDVEAISGGSAADTLTGDAGPNVLAGYGGADTLNGGDGNDFLAGNVPGATATDGNVYNGDVGNDTVTYSSMGGTNGMYVTIDDQACDGVNAWAPPSYSVSCIGADNVTTTIERVNGTNNADYLKGAFNATVGVTLVGFGGGDYLYGTAVADFLDGGQNAEANVLDCDGGTDTYRIQGSGAPSTRTNCENGI